MKEEKLEKLLEKYYRGETTGDDEKLLKDCFSDPQAECSDADKALFTALSDLEKIPEPSSDFESRIFRTTTGRERQKRMHIISRPYFSIIGIAAAFLLLIGSYFLFIYKAEPKDTFSDPQIAYAETMKILIEVSVKLNKGKDELKPLNHMRNATKLGLETLDRSADIIKTNLDKIEQFSQLSDIDVNN